jgi:hypothetical protein
MPADGSPPAPTAIPDLIPELPRPRAGRVPASASGGAEVAGASTAQPGHPRAIEIGTFDGFDELEIEHVAAPAPPQHPAPALPLQLDGVGLAPGPIGVQARQVAPVRGARPAAELGRGRSASVSALRERLRLPLTLIVVGSLVAASGWLYQLGTGELLTVGPVRPLFVSGPLVLIGLALGVVRLFSASD